MKRELLFDVIRAMKLPSLTINWIKECVSTPSYSININGELNGFFPSAKDLRQGDPLPLTSLLL